MPFIHFNRLLWNSWGLCQRLCFGICWRWSLTQFCHLTQKTHTKETLGVSTVSHTTRVFGDYESFSPRHGDARGDARGGSNPTSCQQRDKNSDPPCSLALALAAQSKRNITMQWCWCKMAVGVNDLWTKHIKNTVSISCEKTCLGASTSNPGKFPRLFWHPIFTLARRSGWMPFWSWEWRRLLGMPVVFRSLSSPQPNRAAKHSIAINCVLPCIAQHIATFASFRRYFEGEILSVLSDEQHVVPPLINLASDWSPESILLLGLHQAARLACWISFLIKYKPPISREATWRLCRITWRFQFFLLKRLFPTGEQFEWYFFRWVETTI